MKWSLFVLAFALLFVPFASGALPTAAAPAGLVAAYAFNEGSGSSVADASGNGNGGSIAGATWSASGKYGAALSFDGVNDVVTIADANSLDLTAGMTISAWVKPATLTGWRTVVMKEKPGNLSYGMYANNDNNRPVGEITNPSNRQAIGTAKLAANAWSYLAVSYNGANLRLYVNGTLVKTTNTSGAISTSTGALRIGGNTVWANEYFSGLIDEVRVYNRALTQSEIQQDRDTAIAADTTPPSVSMTAPAHQSTVSGSVTMTASASDNVAVAGVQFQVNGANAGAEDTAGPYSYAWNTATVSNGVYLLTARARDAAGNVTTSSGINVTVNNVADTTPPSVSITSPASGADVSGSVSVEATASDNAGVAGVQFKLDGANLGAEDTSAPYAASWNASTATSGPHTLTAVARDGAGNEATSDPVAVNVVDPNAPDQKGAWSSVMNWPLVAVHSTLMKDGRVLIWDAWEYGTATAKVWDPATNQFSNVYIDSQIFCAAHSILPDGRVLVTGGHDGGDTGIVDASVFDPASNTWTRLDDMAMPRWYPASVTLKDGRVLVLSGEIRPGLWADFPEIYSPYSDTWSTLNVDTSNMHDTEYPLAFLLPNDNIFAIAATPGAVRTLDVTNRVWANLGTVQPKGSAAMYAPGKILYTGGGNGSGTTPSQPSTYVIDMNQGSPSWRQTASMAYGRFNHNNVVLPDGKVMAVGGSTILDQASTTGVLTPELWDPATETWRTLAPQAQHRNYHSTALLLPDGRVLAAGGGRWSSAVDYLTAEIYSPPYLFKGARPQIGSAPSSADYGASINVSTPDAASISSVVLVGMASVTHTLDMQQRYVPLPFTAGSGSLSVTIPSNPSVAPPGPYMLFVLNGQGVPSVAKIVTLNAQTETTAPAVSLTQPSGGATVSGSVTLESTASDASGIAGVEFFVEGASIGIATSTNPYSAVWNTTLLPNGTKSLTAVAKDVFGNTATSAPVSVTVSNSGGPSLPAGIVAAYGLNEGAGGAANDATANNNDGSLSGAAWTAGKYGGALSFDGADDWVTVPDSASLDLTSAMTLSAWLKPSAVTAWDTAILKERPGHLAYALYANTGPNHPSVEVTTSTGYSVEGPSQLPLGVWTHLAATYDGATLRVYVNGTLVASGAASGAITVSTGVLRIGGNAIWGDEFFSGVIDEVRVYNRALSASEVQTDMNTPLP